MVKSSVQYQQVNKLADFELPFGRFVGSIQHNKKTKEFLISHWVLTFLPNK